MRRRHEGVRRQLHLKLDALLDEKLSAAADHILTIDEMERMVGELRDGIGDAALDGLAEEGIREAEADTGETSAEDVKASGGEKALQKVTCPECSHQAHFRGMGARTLVTLYATVTLQRRMYYCRVCDRCVVPTDAALRLPAGSYTRAVELKAAKMGALLSFEKGVKLLQELTRVDISAKQAQLVTGDVGEWAEQRLKVHAQKARKEPEAVAEQMHRPDVQVYISADGVHTPMQEGGYKEAKVGRVRVIGPRGKVLANRYCHHLGGPEQFGKLWYGMVAGVGAAESAKTAIVADGAHWIWNLARCYFPDAEQILDWYHAKEYLGELARICWAELPPHQTQAPGQAPQQEMSEWLESAKIAMWEGRVAELLKLVKQAPQKMAEARKAVRRALGYFTRNRTRMQYDQYRKRGLEIGSGHIESACKSVVSARMKGAGMRWKKKGASAVGTLRTLWLSGCAWDETLSAWPGRVAA